MLSALLAGSLLVSGYLKNIWQYSHSPIDERPYFLNTDRARLTLDASLSFFKAHVDYDHEVFAGSYFRTPDYRLAGLGDTPTWLDMGSTISKNPTALWRHRLYRGWAGFEGEKTALRFGRQRLAWGTGKLWNPIDVLNPYNPTSVERDERSGVDALYLRQGMGELSQAEVVYAPQERWPRSALLGRVKSNGQTFDFSFMGGKADVSTSSWVVGGDFAGNLAEGNLHGEWSYTDPRTRRPYWKALLGYEYTFKDSTALIEYLHNGAGTTSIFRYDFSILLAGRETVLGKDYIGFSYSKDIHPLLKLDLTLITNLNDLSQFTSPSLQWNALPDLYISGGLQRFGGGRLAEYGRLPNLSFLQAQYYF